jgi:serine/threonine protein kinase
VAKVAAEAGSTANRYQILAKLAVGGMAEIFLVRGASVAGVERYCVLKRILRDRASDAQFVQMFVDEARLAAQLQHPNIASVYDIGMLGDSYFFTMEYVHGETVRSLLERAQELNRQVPLACVLTIIAGTASGLHHAHERNSNDGRPLGIVHRDVSPSNLMVSFEGNVKLVDFGVAKADDRAVETQSGTVKGKISYLSPEQCRGARVDRRSDLFSLGIVMWELLTGARLYRRDSDFANMTAIVNEPPPPPSSRRREVPREVDDIVLRLLAKSVADRFQTADEVVEAIENASMRAGTILSTSAVSRLVRDLFGVRAEPWLELDGETGAYEPMELASGSLPRELGLAALDPGELSIYSEIDLSSASTLLNPEDLSAVSAVGALAPPPAPARPSQATVPTAAPARPSSPSVPPSRPSSPSVATTPDSRPPRAGTPTGAPPPSAPPTPAPMTASRHPRARASTGAPLPAAAPGGPPLPAPRPSQAAIPLASSLPGSAPVANAVTPSAPNTLPAPAATSALGASSSGEWNSTLRDVSSAMPWNATLRDAGPPAGMNATLLDAGPPAGMNATLLDAAPSSALSKLIAAAPPLEPNPPSTTLLGVSAPPSSVPSARSGVFPIPAWVPPQLTPPTRTAASSGGSPVIAELPAAPSEPTPVSGSEPRPSPYPAAFSSMNMPRMPARAAEPPARVAWPLVIVIIIIAAAVGVIAVWLGMRTGKAGTSEAGSGVSVQLPLASAGSSGLGAPPSRVPAGSAVAAEGLDAGGTPEDAAAPTAMAALEPEASPPAAEPTVAVPAPPSSAPLPAPKDASPPRPAAAPAPAPASTSLAAAIDAASLPPSPAPPARRPPGAATPRAVPSDPAAAAPAPKAPSPPGTSTPSPQTLTAMFQKDDYPGVVRICSTLAVRADAVAVCVLASCRQHDIAQAKRWLRVAAPTVQDQMVGTCKRHDNIDIGLAPSCPKNTPGCP